MPLTKPTLEFVNLNDIQVTPPATTLIKSSSKKRTMPLREATECVKSISSIVVEDINDSIHDD